MYIYGKYFVILKQTLPWGYCLWEEIAKKTFEYYDIMGYEKFDSKI